MKEHRSKALRVTTPQSIESNDLDSNYHWRGCKDADNELFEMLQFDLAPSRVDSGSGSSSSDDFYFLDQRQKRRLRQQHVCDVTSSYNCSSLPSSTQTRFRIAGTNEAAKFTASSCDVISIKRDTIYRCLCYKFQDVDDKGCELKQRKEEHEDEAVKAETQDEGGGGNHKCEKNHGMVDCLRQRRIQFANLDEENSLERRETCHSRFTGCNRRIPVNLHKNEKNFSLPASASTSASCSSTSISFSRDDRSYSILDLVSGMDLSDNWPLKIKRIKEAISRENEKPPPTPSKSSGLWYNLRDVNGNTALLVSGQLLLKEGCYDKAVELATIFLSEGSDVNVFNYENRTLLSYSIQYMDESIRLTTLLINYGANVWPMVANVQLPFRENRFGGDSSLGNEVEKFIDAVDEYAFHGRDSNNNGGGGGGICKSAFTWFLISIIKRLKLTDHCLQTMYLLAEVMGERPDLMRSHVMSTMFSHAKCYSILGPVFLQIKLAMSPYWTQPPSLKYLCKSAIRKSIFSVSGRFITAENVSSTMLPPSLQSYVMLEN